MVAVRLIALVLALSALTMAAPGEGAYTADQPDIIVVVNESVPLEDVSLPMLREIMLGQRRFWPSGERVELVVEAKPGLARSAFVERISGMTEAQFQHYWTSLVFSHRATRPPRAAPDRRLALALVNAIPGSLTVVAKGSLPEHVRVLQVDGLSSGATGYPRP